MKAKNKPAGPSCPNRTFRNDGAALTVGISDSYVNGVRAEDVVFMLLDSNVMDASAPEAFAYFQPRKAIEIAEALLSFARRAMPAEEGLLSAATRIQKIY